MEKLKICYRIFFIISLIALIIGSSFHGYRIHPENIEKYNIGTTIGFVMIIVFTIFLILGMITRGVYKKYSYKKSIEEKNYEQENNSKKIIIVLIAILIVTGVIIIIFHNKNDSVNSKKNNLSQNFTNNEQSNNNGNRGNQVNLNQGGKINIKINNRSYKATLENNQTASEFIELLPMTVTMTDHLSNEKFYDLPNGLTIDSSSPERINSGDIMLFGSNTLVLFYDSFLTPYSYTKLGKIDDISDLKLVLGNANVEVTFEISN